MRRRLKRRPRERTTVAELLAPRRVQRRKLWRERLGERARIANERLPLVAEGTLTRVVGLALEAVGCEAAMGGRCLVGGGDGRGLETEVGLGRAWGGERG